MLPSTHPDVLRFLADKRSDVDVAAGVWSMKHGELLDVTIPREMETYITAGWFESDQLPYNYTRAAKYRLTDLGKEHLDTFLSLHRI